MFILFKTVQLSPRIIDQNWNYTNTAALDKKKNMIIFILTNDLNLNFED